MPITQNKDEIYHNAKMKIYPDNTVKITVCSRAVFKEAGWEAREANKCSRILATNVENEVENIDRDENTAKAVRRAKNKIFDIALCNKWDYFVTLTINDGIDRYNAEAVSKAVKNWARNMAYRHGMTYLLVPEYHKDGAVHLHGLVAGEVEAVKAFTADGKPIYQKRKRVYNIARWRFGFSTATKVQHGRATAKYITKYITKDTTKIFGNYYYAGGAIRREPCVELLDIDFEQYIADNDLRTYKCATGDLFAYNEIEKGDTVQNET